MSSIEEPYFLDTLRSEAKTAQPGILPKNTKFESYIGHTVINISNVTLDKDQIIALEKGLTFCPTPGLPDKSQIWLGSKEFHRRLELMEFFSRDQNDVPQHSMSFSFNGDHYLQIGGTAMGTATAPNYANLFMDRFETKALANWPLKPVI